MYVRPSRTRTRRRTRHAVKVQDLDTDTDSAPTQPQPQKKIRLVEVAECPICKELIRHPMSSSCGHSFCSACLAPNNMHTCPLCRKKLEPSPNGLLEEFEDYTQHCYESSLDGVKKKFEETHGKLVNYQSTYSEAHQIAILQKLIQHTKEEIAAPTFAKDTFQDSCFTVTAKLSDDDYNNCSVQRPTVIMHYLHLSTGTFLLSLHQLDGRSPLKVS